MKSPETVPLGRKAFSQSALQGMTYSVLALAALAVYFTGLHDPALAYLASLSPTTYDALSPTSSGGLKWFACPDDSAFKCAFFAVPINVRVILRDIYM
jgi:hypothetical protein